jgi:hypothetical protein
MTLVRVLNVDYWAKRLFCCFSAENQCVKFHFDTINQAKKLNFNLNEKWTDNFK